MTTDNTTLTRDRVRVIGDELRDLMREFGAKHGLRVVAGAVRYDATGFKVTLEATVIGEGGLDERARRDWEAYCGVYDLEPEQFGQTFTLRGVTHRITGLGVRAGKFPVLTLALDGPNKGKTFKWAAPAVRALVVPR